MPSKEDQRLLRARLCFLVHQILESVLDDATMSRVERYLRALRISELSWDTPSVPSQVNIKAKLAGCSRGSRLLSGSCPGVSNALVFPRAVDSFKSYCALK